MTGALRPGWGRCEGDSYPQFNALSDRLSGVEVAVPFAAHLDLANGAANNGSGCRCTSLEVDQAAGTAEQAPVAGVDVRGHSRSPL